MDNIPQFVKDALDDMRKVDIAEDERCGRVTSKTKISQFTHHSGVIRQRGKAIENKFRNQLKNYDGDIVSIYNYMSEIIRSEKEVINIKQYRLLRVAYDELEKRHPEIKKQNQEIMKGRNYDF